MYKNSNLHDPVYYIPHKSLIIPFMKQSAFSFMLNKQEYTLWSQYLSLILIKHFSILFLWLGNLIYERRMYCKGKNKYLRCKKWYVQRKTTTTSVKCRSGGWRKGVSELAMVRVQTPDNCNWIHLTHNKLLEANIIIYWSTSCKPLT